MDRQHFLHQVVVVEHRRFRHFAQTVCAQRHHLCVCLQDHRSHAIVRGGSFRCSPADHNSGIFLPVKIHGWHWQEMSQFLRHTGRADRRPATAMRSGEGLVQVEMAQVKAGLACPRDAEDAVGVCGHRSIIRLLHERCA